MKLTFLGTGSAFTVGCNNYHSNLILEASGGGKLLIDCGSDARFSLHEQGLSYKDIHHVYISHLHGDHVGGLEWLAFNTKFDPTCEKPTLYVCETLAHDLWHKVLAGGLSSLEGITAQLTDYFQLITVKENSTFLWHDLSLALVRTSHITHGFTVAPSYGLMFNAAGLCILITTDTRFCPERFMTYYQTADLIYHDCETADFQSGVHAHYSQLLNLPPEIKAKMWLYHYNPGNLPDAKADGFRGFVAKGQCFDFTKPNTLT